LQREAGEIFICGADQTLIMGVYSDSATESDSSNFESVRKPISWNFHFVREFVGIGKFGEKDVGPSPGKKPGLR
jgi:hypothetical protein